MGKYGFARGGGEERIPTTASLLLFYFYLCHHLITLNVFHKLVIWPQHLTLL